MVVLVNFDIDGSIVLVFPRLICHLGSPRSGLSARKLSMIVNNILIDTKEQMAKYGIKGLAMEWFQSHPKPAFCFYIFKFFAFLEKTL